MSPYPPIPDDVWLQRNSLNVSILLSLLGQSLPRLVISRQSSVAGTTNLKSGDGPEDATAGPQATTKRFAKQRRFSFLDVAFCVQRVLGANW